MSDAELRESSPNAPLAEVRLSCGRWHLTVAGLVLAMEGDRCRDAEIPEEIRPAIPLEELEHASIGGVPARDLPVSVVRFFRGECWTREMLEYAAERINAAVIGLARRS